MTAWRCGWTDCRRRDWREPEDTRQDCESCKWDRGYADAANEAARDEWTTRRRRGKGRATSGGMAEAWMKSGGKLAISRSRLGSFAARVRRSDGTRLGMMGVAAPGFGDPELALYLLCQGSGEANGDGKQPARQKGQKEEKKGPARKLRDPIKKQSKKRLKRETRVVYARGDPTAGGTREGGLWSVCSGGGGQGAERTHQRRSEAVG